MKKILVPTDFSEQAKYALDFAYDIAKRCGGEITVLHVIDQFTDTGFNASGEIGGVDSEEKLFMLKMIKKSQEQLQVIATDPAYPQVEILQKVTVGKIFESISDTVSNYEADLIVMGTTGASGIEGFLIGSNAEKVVRLATCPVITVSQGFEFEQINDIVFATYFEDQRDVVLQELMKYQELFGAKIHLLSIEVLNQPTIHMKVKESLEEFAQSNHLSNYEIHTAKAVTVDQGVMDFAESNNMDMIAMTTHGNKGLIHLFVGSRAEDVVNKSNKPVWTFSLKAIPELIIN